MDLYSPSSLTDADRYPTLSEKGRAMLRFLREHPCAPLYRNESGNRLSARDLDRVRRFDAEVEANEPGWAPGSLPPWIPEFVERCFADVPHYRDYGVPPRRFTDVPTMDRGDLGRDVARFVPDPVPVEGLINFQTNGTTGHSLLLPSHPVVAAGYLAFHRRALGWNGVTLRHGAGQVGVVLVGYQRTCFTYTSVTPTMGESGLAKLNLHPADWRDPADRARYLDALDPEIYTGDPLGFSVLETLPLTTRPRALLSTSMTLLPGQKARWQAHFGCPVVDVYSMNEAGPIAASVGDAPGHRLLQHGLYVEILDPQGRVLPPGERGEVTLTGGFNFCLPLLRYRTGDQASLRYTAEGVVLDGLEGRPPVVFRARSGRHFNNIEVTHVLRPLALPQFAVHQQADGFLRVRLRGAGMDLEPVRQALESLFGAGQPMDFQPLEGPGDKLVQYTADLSGPLE